MYQPVAVSVDAHRHPIVTTQSDPLPAAQPDQAIRVLQVCISSSSAIFPPANSPHRRAVSLKRPERRGYIVRNTATARVQVPTYPGVLTADDVLDLPVPDGATGFEFVNGEPVPVMSASPIHG